MLFKVTLIVPEPGLGLPDGLVPSLPLEVLEVGSPHNT